MCEVLMVISPLDQLHGISEDFQFFRNLEWMPIYIQLWCGGVNNHTTCQNSTSSMKCPKNDFKY